MNFSKDQFKQYIQYFEHSFEECIKNNFYSLTEINDISNINHSLIELQNFQADNDFEIYYTNNIAKITTAKLNKNLKYIVFVKLGQLQDMSVIGSIYFIYDYIENQIINNIEKDISFSNYCINQQELNQMLKF